MYVKDFIAEVQRQATTQTEITMMHLLLLWYTICNPAMRYKISVLPASQYSVLSGQRLPDIVSNKNNMS